MSLPGSELQHALEQTHQAMHRKDARAVRYWAGKAAGLAPDLEEPWLYLAAVATPRASLFYLNRALQINPNSRRARQGMHWAVQRHRKTVQAPVQKVIKVPWQIPSQDLVRSHSGTPLANLVLALSVLVVVVITGGWLVSSSFAQGSTLAPGLNIIAQVDLGKATRTPTFTPTYTPSPTPTQTETPTPTLTPTITPIPTETFTPEPTNTPEPPPPEEISYSGLPSGVGANDRWIDVNLSEQRTYAYEGDQVVNSIPVSTGTWQHPTVTGTYNVYVMYRYADMSGPGYYLPNVPYVMYFYQGYGLHGTYWHNNFGTPMSHGCVNLPTDDAGWLFEWSYVGIVVNVHY